MENSAYAATSAHLNSPALVVFSQAASGLQDVLRIQRPFNHQMSLSEASKDLQHQQQQRFNAASAAFSLRHMEAAYGALPSHILSHLQPQFLHPCLSLGSGAGAFRPLTDFKQLPPPSAFAPPKCLKIETNADSMHSMHQHSGGSSGGTGGSIFSPGEERLLGPSPRTDSCSPGSASMSPQSQTAVKEESLDAQLSEDGGEGGGYRQGEAEGSGSPTPPAPEDHHRGFRLGPPFRGSNGYTLSVPGLPPAAHALQKSSFFDSDFCKKSRDPSSCPVCGLAIALGDLETHFMHELERLYKLSGTGISATRKRPRSEPNRPPALPGDSGPEGRWETFQRIRTNRQGRLRIKIRKRRSDEICPICSGHPHRTQEEINLHVERCVRKNSTMTDEDETVDVEGDSELEEWHESQRRRMNSLIEGMTNAVAQAPSSTRMTTSREGQEEGDNDGDDVIVDGDEPEVATVNSSMDVEMKVESGDSNSSKKLSSSSKNNSQQQQQCDSNVSTSDAEPSTRAQMIEELKNRIKQLEAEGGGGTDTTTTTNDSNEDYKCLICLEHYKKPVISTVCWHVHCEECWLHTLGSKKVCPQCSMITAPTDLRRIFM